MKTTVKIKRPPQTDDPEAGHGCTKGTTRPIYERIRRIHGFVSGDGSPTYESLAVELNVSVRCVKRDIHFMRNRMAQPIEYDRVKKRLYYTKHTDLLFPRMNETEVVAFCVAEQAMNACRGTLFSAPLRRTFDKLRSEITSTHAVTPEQIAEKISFGPLQPESTLDPTLFETVFTALLREEEVEFHYANFRQSQSRHRRVHPLHLRYHHSVWTLLAYDPERKEQRNFVLSRARGARRTKVKFQKTAQHDWKPRAGQSIGTYSSGTVDSVRLCVTAAARQLLCERPAHRTQKLGELDKNGFAEMTMTVAINLELENYLLGFGTDVRVLEPASLRVSITTKAKQIAAWGDEPCADNPPT